MIKIFIFLLELTNRIDELENELSDEKEIRIEAENKLEELEFKMAENEAGSGRKTPKVKRSASFGSRLYTVPCRI